MTVDELIESLNKYRHITDLGSAVVTAYDVDAEQFMPVTGYIVFGLDRIELCTDED